MTAPLLPYTRVYRGTQPVPGLIKGAEVWPPPAGEPAAFEPDDLADLAVWFDASQLGLADGAAVDPWPNLGAGPDGVLKGTPAPKLRAGALNGLPVVRFITSEGRIRIVSGSGVTVDWTLIYVGRLWGATPGRVVDGIYPPANLLVGFWNANQDVMYDNGFASNTYVPWTTNWKLYSGDGHALPTQESRLFSDGVLLGSTTTGQGWNGSLALSGYGGEGAEESCDCEVAEVLLYSRKLADAERAQAEGYLREKWMA